MTKIKQQMGHNSSADIDNGTLTDESEMPFMMIDVRVSRPWGHTLGAFAIATYVTLKGYVNHKTSVAFPGLDCIAYDIDVTRPTVIKAIRKLELHGFIKVTRSKGGRGSKSHNSYVLLPIPQLSTTFTLNCKPALHLSVNDVSSNYIDINKINGNKINKYNTSATDKSVAGGDEKNSPLGETDHNDPEQIATVTKTTTVKGSDLNPTLVNPPVESSAAPPAEPVAPAKPTKPVKPAKVAKPRARNPVFDVIAVDAFAADPDNLSQAGSGGRIGKVASALKAWATERLAGQPYDELMSRRLAAHARHFTKWYRVANPNLSLPKDAGKYMESWAAFVGTDRYKDYKATIGALPAGVPGCAHCQETGIEIVREGKSIDFFQCQCAAEANNATQPIQAINTGV